MAIDPGCNAKISYTADGVQTDFTYPFTTIEDTDLYVAVWDDTTKEYNNVTNWTKDGGLVRFDTAPEAGEQIVIYRMTEIDPMKAIFHPGHPVKAGDLNDNFEQLQNAIEDTRCLVETLPDVESERFWNKTTETDYSGEVWSDDDDHIASTAAIDGRIDEKVADLQAGIDNNSSIIGEIQQDIIDINIEIDDIKGDIIDINTEIGDIKDDIGDLQTDKLDKSSGITTEEQTTGQWVSDDDHFAYTGALSERYDVIFLADGESTPQEDDTVTHIQPGKFLITSDNNLYAWNGDSWFQPIAGGGGGGGGGNHTQIATTNPINQSYNTVTNTYSLSFNISSLDAAPSTVRTRRTN
tara:strand:- start:311 stop:1366 length:1056 start_codon:yes stop_codon:yes gene_type:complete